MIKTYKYICPICSKEFWNRDKRYICCSHKCGGIYHHRKSGAFGLLANSYKPLLKLVCSNCGKNFETENRFRSRFKRNFCSMNCCNIYAVKNNLLKGIQRKGHKLTEEHKKKCSDALKGKPCWLKGKHHSLETRIKMHISSKRGLNSPFYITDKIGSGGYGILFTKQLKEKIRVRDNFICQLCGVPELELNKRLDIHHIDHNKENCNEDNLICLCRSCHAKTKLKNKILYYQKFFKKEMNPCV